MIINTFQILNLYFSVRNGNNERGMRDRDKIKREKQRKKTMKMNKDEK